jgi:Holliday junction resolvase RusA-like endonuclease
MDRKLLHMPPRKGKYIYPTPRKNPSNSFMEFVTKDLQADLFLDVMIEMTPTPLGRPRGGQGRFYIDEKSSRAEKLARDAMRIPMIFKEIIPNSQPVFTELIFYDAYAYRKDLDNLVKLIHDAGNKVIWEDDVSIIGTFSFFNKGYHFQGVGVRVYTLKKNFTFGGQPIDNSHQ